MYYHRNSFWYFVRRSCKRFKKQIEEQTQKTRGLSKYEYNLGIWNCLNSIDSGKLIIIPDKTIEFVKQNLEDRISILKSETRKQQACQGTIQRLLREGTFVAKKSLEPEAVAIKTANPNTSTNKRKNSSGRKSKKKKRKPAIFL
eukprot:TRINITY_DN2025_c1_g1_i1.p1 TRINITY_DN2025_c1_g1~~TRINITY_DN2025_c1_g1_i1.p1  ORF type:complete len:144 (+),score=37.99 TRINITY_DN2025_c1_g1_i1:122-553(+)